MIFIDTNIPMYAGGSADRLKGPSLQVLRLVENSPLDFITDSEVLQEMLHRYRAIYRLQQGLVVFSGFVEAMQGRIAPILATDVEVAWTLVSQHPQLSARDGIHAAVMQRLGVTRIVTADGGFQDLPGIERLDPADIEKWRDTVGK